jgi:O-antigen ligase/tetratricopeptide (TPR) repeat protein
MGAIRVVAARVTAAESWLLLLLLAASLVARGAVVLLPMGAVALIWLCRWVSTGWPWVATPFNGILALFLAVNLLALVPSGDLLLSLARFSNLLIGIFLVQTLVAARAAGPGRWAPILVSLVALNWLLLPLVLIGTDWAGKASLSGAAAYAQLPSWLPHLFTNSYGQAPDGIQPNQLAIMLALLLPLALTLIRTPPDSPLRVVTGTARLAQLNRLLLGKRGLIVLASLTLGAILFTQSRGGLLACGVALLVLWGWRYRRYLGWAVLGLLVAAALLLVLPGVRDNFAWLFTPQGPQAHLSNTLSIRVELWQRAVRMIKDFPFTGIGLNTFPEVQTSLYPLVSVNRTEFALPTAHNLYLQAMLDFGIPGALVFCALLLALARGISRATRLGSGLGDLAPVIGAAGAAWLTFGLLDVLDLSSKGGYILWVYIGLLALLLQTQAAGVARPLWRGFGRVSRGQRLALAGGAGMVLLGVVLGGPYLVAAAYWNWGSIQVSKHKSALATGATPAEAAFAASRAWWPGGSGAVYQQGRMHLAAGDYTSAVASLQLAHMRAPRDSLISYLLGQAYQGAEMPGQAAQAWHEANSWFLSFPPLISDGLQAVNQRQTALAATRFQQAQVLAPDIDRDHQEWLANLYYGQALVARQQGRPNEARAQFDAALAAGPHNMAALVEGGTFYATALGQVDRGVALVEQAARENPQSYWCAMKQADLYSQLRRTEDAMAAWQRAIPLAPQDDTAAYRSLAGAYLAANRPAEAVALLNQARGQAPADGEVAYLLGTAQLAAGNRVAGCAALGEAARLSPGAAYHQELPDKLRSCTQAAP